MCVTLANMAMMAGNGIELGGAMQAGGSLLNAVGSLAAGSAKRAGYEGDAFMARKSAEMKATAIRREAGKELGRARMGAVAGGVKLSSGSVLQAETDINRYSEQDALSVLLSGDTQSTALRLQGKQAFQAGINGATDSLVHGVDAWQRTRRRSSFRRDDPYRNPSYVGGSEGE